MNPTLMGEQGADGEVLTSSVYARHASPAPLPIAKLLATVEPFVGQKFCDRLASEFETETRCSWCDRENGVCVTGNVTHDICRFHLAMMRRDVAHDLAKRIMENNVEQLFNAVLFNIALEGER